MARDVLLLHGFTHTGASWEPVREALPESYRALAPDLRGHGSAAHRRPVELAAVLADLGQASRERFVLAGYSMGGRLALHLALAQPQSVERMVLIGASPGLADPAEREARRLGDERLADDFEGLGIGEIAERWAGTPVLAGLPEAVAAGVHRDRLRNTSAGLARALRGLGPGALPSLWGRLPELEMPVVLVVGERDAKFRAIGERMARALPQAELIVVPGAGHAVHLENPRRVAEAIVGAGPVNMLKR